MQQLSKVFGFRTGLCLLLQALGLQAHAADSPRVAVDATASTASDQDFSKSLRDMIHSDTLKLMLSTQQMRVFLREDLRMEWSLTRLPEVHPNDESELGVTLGWRLKFK